MTVTFPAPPIVLKLPSAVSIADALVGYASDGERAPLNPTFHVPPEASVKVITCFSFCV